MGNKTKKIAVVLAGAVAKGAFEAGALQALARTDVEILRIVAASSGALTGTVLASAVAAGNLVEGADRIAEIWRDHARLREVFHLSIGDLLKRNGLSDQKQLRALLGRHVPLTRAAHPVSLRLVVAPLGGRDHEIVTRTETRTATSFEAVRDFHAGHFESQDGLDAVMSAAVASAAFPLVFAPVKLHHDGRCIDGGCVNNTPLKWALEGRVGAQLDAVVVIATSVEHRKDPPGSLTGLGSLTSHLAGMLVDERLYRDLREAEQVNQALDRLDQLVRDQVLTDEQLHRVKHALHWSGRRQVDIVTIRPDRPLDGGAFSGFFRRKQRVQYVEAGLGRGLDVLAQARWPRRPEGPSVRHDDVVAGAVDAVELPGPVERDRPE